MSKIVLVWSTRKKILFRFLFLFLGSSTFLCWDNFGDLIFRFFRPGFDFYQALYKSLHSPFYWLDRHIYHSGYNPELHQSFPGDNHFGTVFYFTLLLFAIVGTAIWSLADKKRMDYERLQYWFRLYIRYVLALTLFNYGLDKLIPVQMSYPSAEDLLTPLGETRRFTILWNFMGVATGYMMLTGICELIGGILLFFRRTALLGNLILLVVLINVVGINVFYNIQVKLFSAQLLLYDLYLLSPYCYRLLQFLVFEKPVAIVYPYYEFLTRWKKYVLKSVLIVLPLLLLIPSALGIISRYKRNLANARRQKIYEVRHFIGNDTIPALATDSVRWKRFIVTSSNFLPENYAVIYNMQDEKDYYRCIIDSNKKTLSLITLSDSPDSAGWLVFAMANPTKDQLLLSGKWKGQSVQILLIDKPLDSLPINKEKIKLVRD